MDRNEFSQRLTAEKERADEEVQRHTDEKQRNQREAKLARDAIEAKVDGFQTRVVESVMAELAQNVRAHIRGSKDTHPGLYCGFILPKSDYSIGFFTEVRGDSIVVHPEHPAADDIKISLEDCGPEKDEEHKAVLRERLLAIYSDYEDRRIKADK